MKFILGIETSCDDTAVSLVSDKGFVLDSRRWTMDKDHIPFGGIIPERASRNHLDLLTPMIDKLLEDHKIETKNDLIGISVTNRPGLLGSLIVGVVTAKTLSIAWNIPFIGVNHLEGHILSPFLTDKKGEEEDILYPQICLIVSGGHTHLLHIKEFGSYKVLGKTKDDAAGEALDKFSNLVGLGFPGGPKVDASAKLGDKKAFDFPRPMLRDNNYDFSFSGLKAAGVRKVESLKKKEAPFFSDGLVNDLCASYLEAAVDVLSLKTKRALNEFKPKCFTVVGGVSANSQLRKRMSEISEETGIKLIIPELKFCTDNAAMIAFAGAHRINLGEKSDLSLAPKARSLAGDFI